MSFLLRPFQDIYASACVQYEHTDFKRGALTSFFADLRSYGRFTSSDLFWCLLLAVFFTILRYALDYLVYKPITVRYQLEEENARKFPESAWKGSYYLFSWCYCLYLVCKYDLFFNPLNCWIEWKPGVETPSDVYVVYMSQLGFYVHSFYATFFMDDIRKDFLIMVAHHILSIALIAFSMAVGYYHIGVLLVFLHDILDVILEYSKCMLYMKTQSKKEVAKWELRANIGFGIFMVLWLIFRIYYYFFSILHNSGHLAPKLNSALPFYFFFNTMLWLIYLMNVYWYYFVILVAVRIFTGKGAKDTRENKEGSDVKSAQKNDVPGRKDDKLRKRNVRNSAD
eukprot:m.307700 g.307700  ORF g.307700 m.307700 type:complete len:339 (+) comp42664_c0_seq1:43-1059(+)